MPESGKKDSKKICKQELHVLFPLLCVTIQANTMFAAFILISRFIRDPYLFGYCLALQPI